MPYKTINDLPDPVKHVLPDHAQEIYLKAFNNAWGHYKETAQERGDPLEVLAAKIAWSAVKKEYTKSEPKWVKITGK